MTMKLKLALVAGWLITLGISSVAQTPESRPPSVTPQAQAQTPNNSSSDPIAGEIALLRKSLQTLNTRLREISEKLLASNPKLGDSMKDQQNRISLSLELLGKAEQRAEILRKQLLELIEKETSVKSRLVQIEEDMRPESIERASSLVGSTRTMELREVRRRVLENERRGYESLLKQTSEIRLRLEDDVKQADALVIKIRHRLFPLIEKEIEKINPN